MYWPPDPSLVTRAAFFAATDTPFLRSRTIASSKLPLASVKACLQSIMGAPVLSRRSLTWAAEIFAIVVLIRNSLLRLKLAVINLDPRTDQLRGSDLVLANSGKLAADARTGAFPPATRQRLPWPLRDACACPCPARLPCGSLRLRAPRLRIPQRPRRLRFRLHFPHTVLQEPGLRPLQPVRVLPPPEYLPSACRPWRERPRQSTPISLR